MKYFVILFLIGFALFFSQAYAIGTPSPERATVSSHGVYDLDFNRIELVESGEQIQIMSDVANGQDREQPFVYSVSIADWTGRLIPWVYSGSIEGVLSPQTGFSPSISWIPEKPGYYKAEIRITEEDGKSNLTPDLQTEFYVVGDMSALNDNRGCDNDKEMVFKIDYSKVGCVLPETLAKLLDRGWARWHIWYDDFFIDNLRQGPQDVDDVHAEFVKQVTMRNSKVGDVLFRKNFEYTCCTFVSNENDDPQNYKIVINFSIPNDKKQLVVEYDLRQLKVTDVELKDEIQLGGPIITESKPKLDPDSNLEINRSCMTLEQSKDIAPFFKVPSYLPEGYSMKCSMSGMPSESYIIYHNKDVSDGWMPNLHLLIDDGAIFIYQYDEKNLKKFETYGSPEQRIQETYDDVMVNNPSLQPQLIRINGMLAYAVDSCPDCGMQTANFTDGTFIQKSTSTETKIKFKDEYGVSYMLKTTLPLDELILVAESLR